MRKALSMVMALLLMTGIVAGLQGKAFAQGSTGTSTTIIDSSGNEAAQVTIDSITDPFDSYDSGYEPQRGFRYVLLTITIENTGDLPFYPSPYGFTVVDSDGFIATSAYISYIDASVAPALPDATIEVGDSVTGTLAFQLLSDAKISAIVYAPSYDRTYILASDGAAPSVGDTATLLGEEGGDIGTITVAEITDPMTDFDPSYSAPRGYRFVAVSVTIENTSSRALAVDPSALRIIDSDGFLNSSYGVYRTEEATAAEPDLAYLDLAPGDSVTGIVSYAIFGTSTPTWFVWYGSSSQFVIAAAIDGAAAPAISDIPSESSTLSGTPAVDATAVVEETPVVDGTATAIAELSPECQELSAWSDELNAIIEPLNEGAEPVDTIEDLEALTVDEINGQIDLLNDFLDELDQIDTPVAAQPTVDALEDLVNTQIDGFQEAADAKDNGDDLQPIYDDFKTQVDTASEAFFTEATKLSDLCPTIGA